MRVCRELGATDVDRAMVWAKQGGFIAAMLVCIEWGATGVDR